MIFLSAHRNGDLENGAGVPVVSADRPFMQVNNLLRQDNVCVDHKCGFGEDTAPDASFTVIGPYENFAKVITGEWDSKTPLVKGKFKLKGNLLAAVAHLGVYQSLIDSKKAVDWDYGM